LAATLCEARRHFHAMRFKKIAHKNRAERRVEKKFEHGLKASSKS